ncbi:MAG: hypothetical protein ACFFCH_05315 [Promethearchaeota archaeon]
MMRLKQTLYRPSYRNLVTVVFFVTTIALGIGSIILSMEYFAVYDTANQFRPIVTSVEKSTPSANERLIIVDIQVQNNGTRLVHIWGYTVSLELNGEYVSQVDIFQDIFLQPGQQTTIVVRILVTGLFVNTIIDAESSGQWNWYIRYPMRVYIGGWLYIAMAYLSTHYNGITEVI